MNRLSDPVFSRLSVSGRKVPEFDDEATRELLVYSYRIIYVVEEEQVTVVSVIHGKQLL